MTRTRQRSIAAVLLVLLVGASFLDAGSLGFIGLDDRSYVSHNSDVRDGLTLGGLGYAFTSTKLANWHPLTWLSHMATVEVFGLEPAGHHWVNVALHLLNAWLLFELFSRVTKRAVPSFFAAALFAVHPLHVESVAWVAERKDVLSTSFWLLAMHAHARRPGSWWTASWLLLGLMTKPMLVTLPFALILFDLWPLGRKEPLRRLVVEKAPLFVLVAVFSALTFWVQSYMGAVQDVERFSLVLRFQNACTSVATYLAKTAWPTGLAVFYPYPDAIPLWKWGGALLGIVVVSAVAWVRRERTPALFHGWFWFLGTLVPVIGLVQVGDQAWADRYAYVPHLGLFAGLAFCVDSAVGSSAAARVASVLGGASLVAFAWLTHAQVERWKDDATLFAHALEVTEDNYKAHDFLGQAAYREGDLVEAELHYRAAVSLSEHYLNPYNNLARILANTDRAEEGIELWRRAIELGGDKSLLHENLGSALAMNGRGREARFHFERALELDPKSFTACFNLAIWHKDRGEWEEAAALLCRALELEPDFRQARRLLADLRRSHPEAACD